MTERRVVELVVDARGAEQGFSRYADAAKEAGAASDGAAAAEDRLQAVMAKATAARERAVDGERQLQAAVDRQAQAVTASVRLVAERATSFSRLAASVDPVVRAHQAAERAVRAADAAVRRGSATTDEAARIVGIFRQRYDEVAAAADRAAAATRRLTTAQQSQVQTRIEGATGVRVDFGTAGRGEDIAAYGAEMDRVRAKLVPLAAAQQAYRSQLAEISQAAKAGAISEAERAAALARAKEAFAGQVVAIRTASAANENGARSAGLHATAWQNLGFQVNDVITSLGSGASPMMVLAQQGGQIYQALDGPKGVTGGLKEVGNFLLGLLTPTRLAVAGLLGIGAAAVAAAISWSNAQSDIRRALGGVGRGAGATVAEIEGIATATAAASEISVSAARALTLELVKTGKVGRESLAPIAALGKDFAATLGLDATEGGQALARIFAEPGKGADELARKYRLLDDATVQLVQKLEQQNDRTRSQQALLQALQGSLTRASELTSGWASAWDRVASAASNAWGALGKAVDRATGGAGGRSDADMIADARTRLDQLRARRVTASDFDIEGLDRQIIAAESRLQRLEQGVQRARQQAAQQEKNDLSLRAGLIARAAVPEVGSLDKMVADRKTLNDAIASGGSVAKESALAIARLDAALNDYTAAGGATQLMEERRAATSRNTLEALKARTPAELGAVAAERERIALMGSQTTQADRAAQIERARAEAVAQGRKAIEDQNATLDRGAQAEGRVAEAWRTGNEALVMRSEAARKAAADTVAGLPKDEEAGRAARYLREQIAGLKKERAEATARMNAETTAQAALNAQVDVGKISAEQANQQLQREVEIRRLTAQAAAAEGQDRADLLRQVDELSGAYQRQASAKADAAAQGIVADQERTLAQLRLEASLVGATADQRERALAVLKAEQDLQRQGIALGGEKGRRIIDNEALIADMRTAKAEYERLAQDVSSVVSGIFDDLFKAGNRGLSGFLDSFARGFARIGTRLIEQNVIAPLVNQALGGAGGAGGLSGIGGLNFGASFDKIGKAVSEGSFDGLVAGFKDLFGGSREGGAAGDGKLGGFGLGSGLVSAGAGAAIGYQSQSPIAGCVGGALSGFTIANDDEAQEHAA